MGKKSIIKYSNFINDSLKELMHHEPTQGVNLRKYRINNKLPKEALMYLKGCGDLEQWCISKLRILLSMYRTYDVINMLKSISDKGLNMVVSMALVNDEEELMRYVLTGTFDKAKIINILINELGINTDKAEEILSGRREGNKPIKSFKWRFLPRSI